MIERYIEALNEQLHFLESSLRDYAKYEIEAKRISTAIRILVHDTYKSTSLLQHLNFKNSMILLIRNIQMIVDCIPCQE